MAENKMFCFQCQETAKGTGCTIKGVDDNFAELSHITDILYGDTSNIYININHRN